LTVDIVCDILSYVVFEMQRIPQEEVTTSHLMAC
jgi:hypothetical protein